MHACTLNKHMYTWLKNMHTHIFGKICMHILVMVRMVDSVFVFVINVYWVFPFVFKYYRMPKPGDISVLSDKL